MSVRDVMYDFGTWLRKKSYPNPKIEFYSPIEGIEDWAPIVSASKMIPEWYRSLEKTDPSKSQRNIHNLDNLKLLPTGSPPEWRTIGQTVKTCPGMQDILTSGYIVPFWGSALIETTLDGMNAASVTSSLDSAYCDGGNADFMSLRTDPSVSAEWLKYLYGIGFTEDEVLEWRNFQWGTHKQWDIHAHPPHQYQTMIDTLPEEYSKAVIKIASPWRIKTPPGMSTLVMPLPYRWTGFEVLPGIINTDYYNTFNMFIVMKNRGAKYNIQFREPMCQWLVFPKHQIPHEVRSMSQEDLVRERKQTNVVNTNWGSGRQYRLLGKIFNKKSGGKCPFS
jgi:hypothetical protein